MFFSIELRTLTFERFDSSASAMGLAQQFNRTECRRQWDIASWSGRLPLPFLWPDLSQ
jgi:hypothetical protein